MPPLSRRAVLASGALLAAGRLTPSRAAADLPVTGAADANLAPFDKLLTDLVTKHKLPGAAAAVTRAGRLVYARGFGHADAEKKIEVRPDAYFRIASVSKPVTAAGVLVLADRGKLKLDEPALKYVALDAFAPVGAKADGRWAKVTVRHCLQHTGGWDRDRKGGFDPIATPGKIMREMKLAAAPTPDEVVRYMMGRPLDFDPGARVAYSNLGYLVLGRVIEAVTREKYGAWVRKHVLAPAGAAGMSLARGVPECRAKGEVGYHDSKERTGRCLYPPRAGGGCRSRTAARTWRGSRRTAGGWRRPSIWCGSRPRSTTRSRRCSLRPRSPRCWPGPAARRAPTPAESRSRRTTGAGGTCGRSARAGG